MREIQYEQWECHQEAPERKVAPLWVFVYDVPYLAPCDVFPPLHILNQIFSFGRLGGGMGPGTVWKPFQISEVEYRQLLGNVLNPDRGKLELLARFHVQEMFVDPALEHIVGHSEWSEAAANKHRFAVQKKWFGGG